MSAGDMSGFSMFDLFKAEVEQNTQAMNQALVVLEQSPTDVKLIEPLMRSAHSIKGAARIVGLDAAVDLAHAMEDAFVAAQEGKALVSAGAIDCFLQGVDWIDKLSKVPEADLPAWLEENRQPIQALVWQYQLIKAGKEPVSERAGAPRAGNGSSKPAEPVASAPAPAPAPAPEIAPAQDLGGFSMMDLFKAEVQQHGMTLNQGLVALEANPTDGKLIEPLMRSAHSIKGAARIVGLDTAVELAHAMEEVFVGAQSGEIKLGAKAIDWLLKGVDKLEQVSVQSDASLPGWLVANADGVTKLVGAYKEIRAGKEPGDSGGPKVQTEAQVGGTMSAAPVARPEPTPVPAQAAPAQTAGDDRVVRVSAENLNRLMGLAGETMVDTRRFRPLIDSLLHLKRQQNRLSLVLEHLRDGIEVGANADSLDAIARDAQGIIKSARQNLMGQLEKLEGFARKTDDLASRLYSEAIASRMRPFSDGVGGFPRTVRDLARKLDKKVKLVIKGERTQVDRDILERIEAPINHMVRNAIDHGMEVPAERMIRGKPDVGTITVEARHWAGMLTVTISDDGKGIDPEAIRRKVIAKKMVPQDVADSLSESELYDFMFLPGFSTAEKVSEISGRGVGLDVVQTFVQEVSGTIRVASQLGKGSTFTLTLPITLSVIRAVVVEIAGEPYAFAMTRIDRVEHLNVEEVVKIENRQSYNRDGVNIGLIPGAQVLGFEAPEPKGKLCVVVVSDRNQPYGLVVDRFVGEQDLVVRKLDPRLGKLPDIAAAALMEDGSPLLIIDTDDMLRSIDKLLHGGRLGSVKTGMLAGTVRRKRVLVVDDSITVREVERKLLENRGYQVEIAVDGADGLNAVRDGHFDLVISDVDMPRMTGLELVATIKADPKLKQIPVMIVSYKDREEDRMRGLEAGANAYLTKGSFHDQTLINMVRDLIGEPEA
jgi:two-component system, chemotaxis family, sensor histidine kinase and response regulator WspE